MKSLESFKINRYQFYIISQLLYQYIKYNIEFDSYNDALIFKDSDTNKNFVLADLNKPLRSTEYVLIIYFKPLKQIDIEH